MDEEEIDDLIKYLNDYVDENRMWVFPDKQTYDCCDCTLCKDKFFKTVRRELQSY